MRPIYFSTKKDIWFACIIWGFIFGIILLYIFGGKPVGWQLITYRSALGYLLSALIIFLLVWIWFGTNYKVEEGFLKISYGPFRSKINITEIKKIRKTKNPFTAPALSVDRLEILFGKYHVINISPKNESGLIQSLLTINPRIQLEDIPLDAGEDKQESERG